MYICLFANNENVVNSLFVLHYCDNHVWNDKDVYRFLRPMLCLSICYAFTKPLHRFQCNFAWNHSTWFLRMGIGILFMEIRDIYAFEAAGNSLKNISFYFPLKISNDVTSKLLHNAHAVFGSRTQKWCKAWCSVNHARNCSN